MGLPMTGAHTGEFSAISRNWPTLGCRGVSPSRLSQALRCQSIRIERAKATGNARSCLAGPRPCSLGSQDTPGPATPPPGKDMEWLQQESGNRAGGQERLSLAVSAVSTPFM